MWLMLCINKIVLITVKLLTENMPLQIETLVLKSHSCTYAKREFIYQKFASWLAYLATVSSARRAWMTIPKLLSHVYFNSCSFKGFLWCFKLA